MRAHDLLGMVTYVPNIYVENNYRFDVGTLCAAQLVYDDGGAEMYNYIHSDSLSVFEWAVKFGPVTTPLYSLWRMLCRLAQPSGFRAQPR